MRSKIVNMDYISDEECTVESESAMTPTINQLYSSKEFENTLVKDKGKIDKQHWDSSLDKNYIANDEKVINTNICKLVYNFKRSSHKISKPYSMAIELNYSDITDKEKD